MSFGLEPLYKRITDLEKQLKDAQKEIAENKTEFERNNAFTHKRILELEGVIEAANKKVKDIKLDAILGSMLAIYEGSSEWNKGFKAGAADMIIKIQKELLPILEIPRKEEPKQESIT